MTRFLFGVLALCLAPSSLLAANFVKLSTNQQVYQAGDAAQVRIRMVGIPESARYEFFLKGTFLNQDAPITKITEREAFAFLSNLPSGQHSFSLEVFQQDRDLAGALSEAVRWHDLEIARLTALINESEDPSEIAELQAQVALHQARKADAFQKLSAIRRKVEGPVSIQIQVN